MSPPDSYIERRQTVGMSREEEERQDQRDLHISLLVQGAVREAVKEAIAACGENIQIRRFERFVLGEGIEKAESNLAAEVAAATGAKA